MGHATCLRDYLDRSLALPFVWGERDCCFWAADWIAEARGIDPVPAFRGRYRSPLGCERLLRREGGLACLATRIAAAAGLMGTEVPDLGDVGLVDTARGPALMVCVGSVWAWKAPAGVLFAPAAPRLSWSV